MCKFYTLLLLERAYFLRPLRTRLILTSSRKDNTEGLIIYSATTKIRMLIAAVTINTTCI